MLQLGQNYLISFLVLFAVSQNVGGLLGSAVLGSYQVMRTRAQQMPFPAGEAVELPYVPAGGVSVQWYGNDGALSRTGRSVRATGSIPAIGEVSYPVRFAQYRLIPPSLSLSGEETWPILIVVTMEAAT